MKTDRFDDIKWKEFIDGLRNLDCKCLSCQDWRPMFEDVIASVVELGYDVWRPNDDLAMFELNDDTMEICQDAMSERIIKMWQIIGYEDAVAVIYRRKD